MSRVHLDLYRQPRVNINGIKTTTYQSQICKIFNSKIMPHSKPSFKDRKARGAKQIVNNAGSQRKE
jgi:hypothetical protein